MKYNEIVRFLFEKCPEIVQEMKQSNHHYDESKGILNPYHLEGDVLTHTLMVLQQAEIHQVDSSVMYGALFHDFGKFDCREENHEKQRVSFFNHEAVSAFKALKYMKMLNLDSNSMVRIFKMVAMHTDLYHVKEDADITELAKKFRYEKQLIFDLVNLGVCDGLGRFSDTSISDREEGARKVKVIGDKIIQAIDELPIETSNKKRNAVVMIGLPMSGKSTFINNFKESNPDYVIISRDEIILELGQGASYSKAYHSVDQSEVDKVFDERIKNAVANKKDIIFDLTSLSKKARRRISSKLTKDYSLYAKVVITDLETLIQRNKDRSEIAGKYIPWKVVSGMMKTFALPMYDEFEKIDYILS